MLLLLSKNVPGANYTCAYNSFFCWFSDRLCGEELILLFPWFCVFRGISKTFHFQVFLQFLRYSLEFLMRIFEKKSSYTFYNLGRSTQHLQHPIKSPHKPKTSRMTIFGNENPSILQDYLLPEHKTQKCKLNT